MPKPRVPKTVDLSIAINQAPADAVAYFRAKGFAISDDWQDVWTRAHARAFTVAKAAQMDVLTAIRNQVDAALSQGLTAKQFQANLKPQLEKLGWWGKKEVDGREVQLGSPYRLNTIYRQNLQTAYMAGRYRRMLSRTKTHPYWQYVAIDDGQTRPAHARLRGKVFRFDDPIWDIIYPPNGWGCRCRVRALTEAQVKAMGITVENGEGYIQRFDTETVARGTGEVLTVPHARIDLPDGSSMSPDLGWAYSPGEAAFGTDVAVAKKLGTIQSLDTRAQFIQALNNSPLRHAQFAQWTDEVLAANPGQKRRPGLGVQALGFMTPSIQASVTARLGREPSALLAITERQLSTAQASVTPNKLQQLPLMLAKPEAVLWDSDNQTLLYVYSTEWQADDERASKLLIASHWSLQRTPNEGQVEGFKLSLAELQQAQYQVLEGQLKG
ncbi:phage head morphogenesis protein, SPP1 gp7 family [Shewanella baltica OS195]|uniref:Phage head morphogenesis protein, SPP1 gp7 family n=1 Tax=Shewanella baltica (strain OS195) TaxID=399599 RepID=A9L161_SHEB9|nr:phage minor head protein [Shewanella baltica]ABX49306.1 phage head morphogenesis protein, SPP1 gp7 family [Shewanella baltica OS195]ADT94296.1 phage head morphogenesis protein, SPP1 gp7 family [Shewanella baltica OS678]